MPPLEVPRRGGAPRGALLVLGLLLGLPFTAPVPPAAGQGAAAGARGPAPGLAVVRSRLLLLPAAGCDVRYSPGSLDRGATAQEWLCELATGAARAVQRPTPLEALLLTRDEWAESGLPCAYGVPCPVAPGVLALPAAGDPGTVELWREVLGRLPAIAGTPLVGTVEEVASLAPADALASALAARDLALGAGFVVDEPWMIDLLGHLIFLDAARRGGNGRGEAMEGFWLAVRARGPQSPDAGPAAALPSALRAALLRQAELFAVAQEIGGKHRRLPARQLRRMQERGGGTLREADLRAEWPEAFASLDAAGAAAPVPR